MAAEAIAPGLSKLLSDLLENIERKAEEREKKTNEFITGLTSDLRRQTEETIQRYTEDTMASVGELQTAILSLTEERRQTIPAVGTTTSPVVKEASAVVGTENPNEPDRPAVFHQFARPSFMLKQRDLSPDPVAGLGAIPVATGTVMVKQERVPTGMEVMHATLKGLKVGIDNQARFFAKTDQWKNLPSFFTDHVRRLLAENEHRHGRNMTLTEHGVMKLHDDAFILIFVAYVRVHYMGTRRGFTETIVNSVPKLRAEGPDPERPMTIEDYDNRFHAVVNKQLDTLEKIVELAYLGATLAEVKEWPGAGWGKGDMYGVNRILMDCFDPYKDNFPNQIGMENLKAMKTAEEFFAALKTANNSNANRATRLRAEMAEISPMVKLDQIVCKVNEKRRTSQIPRTREGDRPTQTPDTSLQPATPKPGYDSGYRHSPTVSGHPTPVLPDSSRLRPNLSYARTAVIEDEENCLEDTFDSEGSPYLTGYDHRRVAPLPQYDSLWGDSVGYTSDEDGSLSGSEQRQRSGIHDYPRHSSSPPDPMKPCFRQWKSGQCPGNCGWDHSLEAMKTLTRDRVSELLTSPFTPPEYIQAAVQQRLPDNNHHRPFKLVDSILTGPNKPVTSSGQDTPSGLIRSNTVAPRLLASSRPIPGFSPGSS